MSETLPTITKFYATWCGPCKMLDPVMVGIVGGLTGKANYLNVDIDSERGRELAVKYGVMSVPTVIITEGEKEVLRHIGYATKSALEPKILAAIGQ